MAEERFAKLPQLLARKIYKTGQTRGADDDVIFQNRVGRNSTVLIPYAFWEHWHKPPEGEGDFENGFIVLVSPPEYFGDKTIKEKFAERGLQLGRDALVFYETREHWNTFNPDKLKWRAAESRLAPLKGQYVARVPATTAAAGGGRIVKGFARTSTKGAGIRVYEYASSRTIARCRYQLEALFWLCHDSLAIASKNGMTMENAKKRNTVIIELSKKDGLLDEKKLIDARILNKNGRTVCPLCLEELSSEGFFNRLEQAEGRVVPDLTVTQLNLFHIEELHIGTFNHRPYNLGWGHHHCNVVVKDSGIEETLNWMSRVLEKNAAEGHLEPKKSAS